ncbi:uncharacterized protein LOC132734141 [Ruditapes philippinarum]|uniref:uncharacterized protein LOC132734141 n=1 Tax=Ruditapes philippinarum TaxID=129788 RepID=UPI00295A70E3|nr:uncharacterized protein LOC132734141 [Ruditapes philippinarum]
MTWKAIPVAESSRKERVQMKNMAKSKAEIMREYRKRMKQDPEKYQEYLLQARNRKKQNCVASSMLPKRDKLKRNAKNKEYLQRYRQKKKIEREIREIDHQPTQETSGYDTGNS